MRKSSYTRIGAFVFVAAALAVAAIVLMGSGPLRKREVLMETYVEDTVQGVSEGSAVKYRGIPVGTVKSVSFAWSDYKVDLDDEASQRASRYARIVFAIALKDDLDEEVFKERAADLVKRGLRVHMKSQGITGLVYIDLDFENPDKPTLPVPWEPQHLYVPAVQSLSKTLFDAMQHVAEEIRSLGGIMGNVSNMAAKVDMLIDHADSVLLSTGRAMEPIPGVAAQVSNLVAEAAQLVATVQEGAGTLPSLMAGATNAVEGVSAFVAELGGKVDAVACETSNTLAAAGTTLSGIGGPARETLEDLDEAIKTLLDILTTLREDPMRLFRENEREVDP